MSEAVWAESVWNVVLRLSLISCPVRLVPAIAPIDREFERLLSESGGIIDLTHFVRRDPVEGARVATSYDHLPERSGRGRDARRAACRRCGAPAATRSPFSRTAKRERMLLIEPYGGGLRLSVMRRPLAAPGIYDEPAERQSRPELVEIAEAVIGRHLHEEDANALHERYENRLRALIAAEDRRRLPPEPGPSRAAAAPHSRSRRKRKPRRDAPRRSRAREPMRKPRPPIRRSAAARNRHRNPAAPDRYRRPPLRRAGLGRDAGQRAAHRGDQHPAARRAGARCGRVPRLRRGRPRDALGRQRQLCRDERPGTGADRVRRPPDAGDRRAFRCRLRGLVRRGRRGRTAAQRRNLPLAGPRRPARSAARQLYRAAERAGRRTAPEPTQGR